jgi:chemotaxis protein MotA
MSVNVIFSNITGFDGLIFILALINLSVFFISRKSAVNLYESMHRKIYTPSCKKDIEDIQSDMKQLTDRKISELLEKAGASYTLYVNLSSIFPLMGILGTVISLIGMTGIDSDINNNFFAALTSTFWGLVFAVIFKFMDGFISAKLDDGERSAELFLQRNYYGSNSTEDEKIFVFSGDNKE